MFYRAAHIFRPRSRSVSIASSVFHSVCVSRRPESTLSSDISRENCSALVRAPSTFHALHKTPNDEYFESEHARTTLSLSEISPGVVRSAEDEELVLSPRARSPELSESYSKYLQHSAILPGYTLTTEPPFRSETSPSVTNLSTQFTTAELATEISEHVLSPPIHSSALLEDYPTSLGCSKIVPAYTSTPAPPHSSDTPPSTIQPFSSFCAAALASRTQEHAVPQLETSEIVQTRKPTASVSNSQPDHVPVVPYHPDVQEFNTPSLFRSAAPPTVSTISTDRVAFIYTSTSNLAPPYRSKSPTSIAQPPTSTMATACAAETLEQPSPSSECPIQVFTCSPSLSVSIAPPISDKPLYTASLFVSRSPTVPTSRRPRLLLNKIALCFLRRQYRCAAHSVRVHHFHSLHTLPFSVVRSSVHPLLKVTSRRLDFR